MYFGEAALARGQFIYNIPDISPQQVEKMIEFFQNEDNLNSICEAYGISVDILNESAQSAADHNLQQLCKKTGVNYSQIKTEINKSGTKIATTIKNEGLNKDSKKSIAKEFNNLMDNLKNTIHDTVVGPQFGTKIKEQLEDSSGEKIAQAITLLIMVVLANTIVINVLIVLLGFPGMKIGIGLIGPIIEEVAKQVSIKGKYEKEFTVLFNIFEFTNYVTAASGVPNIVPIRVVVIGMHLTTTIIQWITNNPKLLEKFGANTEEQKDNARLFGFLTGVAIHATWNSGFGSALISLLGLA